MQLEIEETGPVERRLRIELPTVEVDAAFDAVYRGFGRSARLPGFRKGKVPRSVLERYFRESAQHDVLQRLIQESLPRAIDRSELPVLGEPRIEPTGQPQQGAPFAYDVSVEIRPPIELKKLRGLVVHHPELPEPDQDPVEAHLEELRVAHAQLVEEPEGVTAARGHFAVIDYDATVDGRSFEGGSGRESTVEIGAGRSIPGFEDELIGLSVAQERDFELALPESYPGALSGKTASFHVKLVGLKRRELPSLDDEFAKDVSEFETLAELEADLRRRVDEGREAERKRRLREAVVEALIESNPFPVPPGLIERALARRIARTTGSLQGRIPEEEIGKLIADWREQWRPVAEREVRLGLLVPEIAKAEGIDVSSEEVEERLRQMAEEEGQPLSKLKRVYRERGLQEALEAALLEEKVVEFLLSQATLSDG
ncbi:MAG: trigger factor [Myxococcota bacterium]